MVSELISDAINVSFEINYLVKPKYSLTHVPWWNKELAKLRVEVKLFNRARNSSEEGDWKRFHEVQRA